MDVIQIRFLIILLLNHNLIPFSVSWIHPVTIWSKLKFPSLPEASENKPEDIGDVLESYDVSKFNVTLSKDGYVVGGKFCQCGRSPWRIRHNSDIENISNDIPWTATLILCKNKRVNVFCGGALLNDRTVITAAHCVQSLMPTELSVHISEDTTLPSSSTIYKTPRFNVKQILIHPKYNPKTIQHDIALLKLEQVIDFFEYFISPVCLPVTNEEYSTYKGTVTGWVTVLDSKSTKSEDNLQKTTLDLMNIRDCGRKGLYKGLISNYHVCTKSCEGDHGGQLIVEKNQRKHLIGIGSWGFNCKGEAIPSVYTRVSKYSPWILENSDDSEWCTE